MTTQKTGILLINLGTPDDPSVKSVRRYLREFLLDPRVIDLPKWIRWTLVNLVILPFRPKQSAKAYQEIWQEAGSPLRIHSQALTHKLQQRLGDDYSVALGMRYGNPSIKSALAQLHDDHVSKIVVLPLFPQYSSAATGSAIEAVFAQLKNQHNLKHLDIRNAFYQNPGFIHNVAELISKQIQDKPVDHLLFSYHGLPERHIHKSGCKKGTHCNYEKNCPLPNLHNQHCYRAQCFATTSLIADELNLTPGFYSTAFQSRLGRTPWIGPYTDHTLEHLANNGIKNLAVTCPSFVADCLETLEEIGIRAKEQWQSLGGEQFYLIPCLNSEDNWVNTIAKLVEPSIIPSH